MIRRTLLANRKTYRSRFSLLLLGLGLFGWMSAHSQRQITLDIDYPKADGFCTGTIILLDLEDCGVPGARASIEAISDLNIGEEVTGLCPGVFNLLFTDTSGYYTEHRIPFSSDSLDGAHSYELDCFDSTYYSPDILIYTEMKEVGTATAIPSGILIVKDHSGRMATDTIPLDRVHELLLPLSGTYLLTYSAPGYYTKSLEVDSRVSDPWAIGVGFEMEISMKMLPLKAGLGLDILDAPMNVAVFEASSRQFVWDMEKAQRVSTALDSLYFK